MLCHLAAIFILNQAVDQIIIAGAATVLVANAVSAKVESCTGALPALNQRVPRAK